MLPSQGKHPMVGRQLVDWKALKAMGWPFCRQHTIRKMEPEILRSSGRRKNGDYREWLEPNPDPFPPCVKLGWHRNSPLVWRFADVRRYFERHGLVITDVDTEPVPGICTGR